MTAQPDNAAQPAANGLARLLAGYRPLAGIHDEMMGADGNIRTHWRPFLEMLAALGPDEINKRFAAADRYLRNSGALKSRACELR